jgi:hypothetical protein
MLIKSSHPHEALNWPSNLNASWKKLTSCAHIGPEMGAPSSYFWLNKCRCTISNSLHDFLMILHSEDPASLSQFLINNNCSCSYVTFAL